MIAVYIFVFTAGVMVGQWNRPRGATSHYTGFEKRKNIDAGVAYIALYSLVAVLNYLFGWRLFLDNN